MLLIGALVLVAPPVVGALRRRATPVVGRPVLGLTPPSETG